MSEKYFHVCMLASGKRGTIYIDVTSDLPSRVILHKERHFPKSFTAKYEVTRLMWSEKSDL